ncbi:MAG TPA: DUF3570 domain-containing protein, partial [Pseudomonadales bacterium]|nr:DUF3570 domain-containing protein [Pseudomonadales bacterium]
MGVIDTLGALQTSNSPLLKTLNENHAEKELPPLAALMFAALALPGLNPQNAEAADAETASFQYGHYQESARHLGGVKSKFDPIQADSLHTRLQFNLNTQLQGEINVLEDAWSGATPIATAPASARGNRVSSTHMMTGASMEGMHHMDGMDEEGGPSTPHVTTGASPYLFSALKLDGQFRPLQTDHNGVVTGGVDKKLVHTLSGASREVRKEMDLNLTQAFSDKALLLGTGISQEPDFDSVSGKVGGRWDFNQKRTSLNAGISYTRSDINALLDHDAVPHIYEPYMFMYERPGDDTYNRTHVSSQLHTGEHAPRLTGERKDWGSHLGMTQIINPSALIETGLSYSHSEGYLANPYKTV